MTTRKVKSIETQKAPEPSPPSHVFAQSSFGSYAQRFDAPSVPQMGGNLAVQRLLRSGAIQGKLSINQPSDPYELEADRVAQRVVSMPAPPPSLDGSVSSVQRYGAEKDEVVQTKPLVNTITPTRSTLIVEPISKCSARCLL